MDQAKMLNQIQAAATDALQQDAITLGDITIVSALLTELAVTLLLFEEVEKFRDFNDNESTPCEKVEFNKAVAEVLRSAGYLEDAIVKKIRAGIVMNEVEAELDPVMENCCRREQ